MAEWDLLNWHAMVIELSIAGVMAIGLSIYFYRKQKKDHDSIRKLESQQKDMKLSFSISKIRGHLGALQAIYQKFLDEPKTENGLMIMTEGIEMDLDLKNNEIELLQNTINQSSDVLNMEWMNRLNDLCQLMQNNPSGPRHINHKHLNAMNCDSCQGIITQIIEITRHLPNPYV